MTTLNSIFIITISFTILSCNQSGQDITHEKAILKTGVIENIISESDSSLSYYQYLPEKYNDQDSLPAIVFFDAHARGKLPLEKYRELSEKYGYILIGSNNSKNGLIQQKQENIANAIINDSKNKLKIKSNCLYLAGFSGGGRVTGIIAAKNKNIAGIISCGAGPQQTININRSFVYIGIAGNQDFNYLELKKLDNSLESKDVDNMLLVFNGGHDWAPDSIMEKAFLKLKTNSFKNGFEVKDTSLITNTYNYFITKTQKLNSLHEKYLLHKTIVNYLDGLCDVQDSKSEIAAFFKTNEAAEYHQKEKELLQQELDLQQKYYNAFSTQNMGWWKTEIANLHSKTGLLQSNEELVAKRTLNYLSLLMYMGINSALNKNATTQADIILELYKLIDPENPDVEYLGACIYSMQGRIETALNHLEKAIEMGYKDFAALRANKRLNNLRSNERYNIIVPY